MRILTLIILLLSYTIAKSQIGYVNDMIMSPLVYKENFREIIKNVNEKYSHFDHKKIDKDSLSAVYLDRVNEKTSNKEYIDILLQYFAALQNGHSYLAVPKYFIDSWAELIKQRVFLADVSDSVMISQGIAPKDEVLKIDGILAYSWLLDNSKYTCASTEAARINWTTWRVFASYFGGKRTFKIRTQNGIKTIELEFKKISPSVFKTEEKLMSKIINDSIGYINIPGMNGATMKSFKAEYERLQLLPNLIIDLRKNGGGNSNIGEKMLSYLIFHPVRACVSRKKRKPKKNNYQGKLFLLIGPDTFSSAESFVIDMKESGRAVLIGSPTGGDTGNRPKTFKTEYGFNYRFPTRKPPQVSFKGFPMEGVGIQPDYKVFQTVEGYYEGKDIVLEYAINKIEGNAAKH